MNRINSLLLLFCLFITGTLRAQVTHWQCDPYAWEYDMTAYVTLSLNNEAVNDLANYEIAAFCGDECRGIATVQSSEKDGQSTTYGYLRIRSNQQAGEVITFKAYDSTSEKEYDIVDYSLPFQSQEVVGLPSSPVVLDIKIDVYTVSVSSADEAMGRTTVSAGTVVAGSDVTATATPEEGYHFVKWSDETTDNPYVIAVNSDVSLTAIFAPNQYTITFNTNGGSEIADITADYKSTLTKPEDPTKEGYSFAGWVPEFPETMPLNGASLSAQWELVNYSITYDLAGGTIATPNQTGFNVESEAITLNNPTREGYTFAGWTGTGLTEATTDVTIPQGSTGNRTYTATWVVNQYTMTFVFGNGQQDVVLTQDYGSALTAPEVGAWEGHTFTAWSPAVPVTVPAADMTFTAQWDVNTYTLTFIADGVTLSQEQVAYGTAVTAPDAPNKEGHTFTGWDGEIPATMPASDLTFTAQYRVNQYTMTFVFGNGQDDVALTQDYGTALTAPEVGAWEGHTFTAWSPSVPATVPAADMTFTAQWDVNTYTLTFIADGVTLSQEQVAYGTAVTAPDAPNKEGHTFTGWDGEIPATMPASDLTFTAQYRVNQYTMTFVFGNGQDDVALTQDYGTALTAPEVGAWEGHTFTAWSPSVPATVPAADMTFTAQWDVNTYTLTFIADGETLSQEQVAYGTSITAPDAPNKEGHTFTGWDGEIPATMPASDLTFTAQYRVNQYTMTFVFGNGLDDVVLTQDYGSALTAPEVGAWEGHTFTAWSPAVPATVPAADMTFTAQWDVNTYTLTFIADGVTLSQEEVAYGTSITAPDAPSKEGYTFTGWDGEIPATMPAGDLTFTAQYRVNQYTMTFVFGNGQDDVVLTQDYGSALTAPEVVAWEGHTFTAWSPAVPATVPAADMTFTAQWDVNTYTLTFIADGVTLSQEQVAYGTSITAPDAPSKEGYTFTGWDGEIPATMPAGDLTFTAQYRVNQYTMTFIFGNGQDDVVLTQDYGSALTAPEVGAWEGHTFTAWSPSVPATVPAADMTFTAQWDVNTYTLTFIADGVTLSQEEVAYGTAVTAPDAPNKEGHTFTGWDGEIPATMPASDLTFTAQYRVNQYTMTFVFGNGLDDVVLTQDYGSALTAPEVGAWEGHTFTAWSPAVPATVPAGDMTFTAQWDVNTYTLTFIADGVTLSQEQVAYGTSITAPDAPSKEGHTFMGWDGEIPATMPAGDLTFTAQYRVNQYTMTFVFGNGQPDVVLTQDYGSALTAPEVGAWEGHTFTAWSPSVPATVPAADMTFTAQWDVNTYTLTFIADGVTLSQEQVAYGTSITAPDAPSKEGYTFTGWDGEIPATMPAGDLTFTAQYRVNQYTMTFVFGNGQPDVVLTQDYGSALTAPEVPDWIGHVFAGWDTEIPTTVPAQDMVFTAQWILLGDLNGSQTINGSDIVEFVSVVMGQEYTPYADLYPIGHPDGIINGMDLVIEIDLVLAQEATNALPASNKMSAETMSIKEPSRGTQVFGVQCERQFVLAQMVVELSDGMQLSDVTSDENHHVAFRHIGSNKYMIVCYSDKNDVFADNENMVKLHYVGSGNITVVDLLMVDADKSEYTMSESTVITGISSMTSKESTSNDIFSLNGHLVKKNATTTKGLPKGIYIVDGRKVIIK